MMEKNYRIHTNIISDTVLNVNMTQDYDFLEVLSLKLRTSDTYRLHSSNYGVIVGRVLANDAFGIPNAKVSVFIERDVNDPTYMESLYPYSEVMDSDKNGRRYNLLPDYSDKDCYRIVGTFPNKRLVLDDDINLELYDKYWKYTTVTNNAGDYMIFGVPSGSQQIHVDIDLSNIGMLSQAPYDFSYKGYNMSMFDSPKQFKESTNLDGLAQIFSQNKSVFVYPFWGDSNLGDGIAAITRCDIQIQYKFEPTCVFMGAIISDNEGNSIGSKCAPADDNGMNYQLVTGEGTIEMIRKTPDGLVEEYSIQGNQLIDSNGVWCYQIPMNLDFIATDEYGNVVPTDNPNKGIPTRAQVRFRFSKNETSNEGHSRHTAKYLVPMNPTLIETKPQTAENGEYIERMYKFGSETPDDCFRDLYWNNVYSVKNYIPKLQVAHRPYAPNYTGLKGSNLATDQNPVPFNKLRIDLPIMYIIVCIIFGIIRAVVQIINIMINIINTIISVLQFLRNLCLDVGLFEICPFFFIPNISYIGCVSLGGGLSPDNTAYYPACDHRGMEAADCPEDMENCRKSANSSELMDLVQQKLAEDYKIVKLDFYQDWLNGSLYMPLWYWRKSKKKKFLFFTIKSAKNEYCDCNKVYSRMKSYVTCSINYTDLQLGVSDGALPENEDKWHKSKDASSRVFVPYGIIKGVENKDGLTAYYYAAIQPTSRAGVMSMESRGQFPAFRAFATDIILLGNLNEDNLYGLPQFFKALPSTTANIPPIASISEAPDDSYGTTNSDNTLADAGETGPTLITGMDWIDGDGSPAYSEGLFMLLSCTYAHTKAKSCINVERLSELGMNLDMTYDTEYPSETELHTGTFERDGFISKYELDDTENRAMFATMNHLGFVPNSYQVEKGYYQTQVYDKNTNYLIPKFKFLYPTDLDGRMLPLMERYKNGFQQVLSDDKDEAYVNFRLGDRQDGSTDGQFYDVRSMPLYNNSFYFYFGVNKGNTAIEKFNSMFFAQCFKNSKKPFTLNIKTRPQSYCKDLYKDGLGDSLITVTSDDIQTPYDYMLIDSNGEEVKKEYEIMARSFEISGVANGSYTLRVTDGNGKHIDTRVNLELPSITITYSTRGLGTKYYAQSEGVEETPMRDICNAYDYCGKITFDKLLIDGYEFAIGGNTNLVNFYHNGKWANVEVWAKPTDNNIFTGTSQFHAANLIFQLDSASEYVKPCLCNNSDEKPFFIETTSDESSSEEIVVFGFNVYKPKTFLIKLTQFCGNAEVSGNTSTSSVSIDNGKKLCAYFNGMPLQFMLDNVDYFYPPSNEHEHLKNWLTVHSEDSYVFPPYNQSVIWSNFVNITDDISSSYNKEKIIKYKFSSIFNVAKAVYIRANGNGKFKFSADGGVQPLLYRSLAPYYKSAKMVTNSFVYSDNNYATVNTSYPNIVGENYKDGGNGSPRINRLYRARNRENLGNYFMVASNNGGYINAYSGTCSEYSLQVPDNSAVNVDEFWKMLGQEEIVNYVPELVYKGGNSICQTNTNPYFKAMFVDRRFDYDILVLGPVTIAGSYDLVNFTSEREKKEVVNVRVVGSIYNGIEMAYDDDYNIISANRHDASIINTETGEELITEVPSGDSVSPNATLEYTYAYSSGFSDEVSAVTILNPPGYIWKNYDDPFNKALEEMHFTGVTYYNPSPESATTDQPILKTFYSATMGNVDIRQLFWSNENKDTLKAIANISDDSMLPFIIYDHSEHETLYNGAFGRNNYPTKRYLDIGCIQAYNNLAFNITSCGYDLGLSWDGERKIFTSNINEGESVETSIHFGSIIPSPRGDAEEYGHFMYALDYYEAVYYYTSHTLHYLMEENSSLSSVGLGMNYQPTDYGYQTAYSRSIKLFTINDIKEFKTSSDIAANIEEIWHSKKTMDWATVNNALAIMQANKWDENELKQQYPYDNREDDNYFLYYGNSRLSSDQQELYKCRITCGRCAEVGKMGDWTYIQTGIDASNFNFGEYKFLAACAMRDIVSTNNNENLTKDVKVFDFSEFYDCRNIHAKCDVWFGDDERDWYKFKVTIFNDSENEAIKDIEKVGICVREHISLIPIPSLNHFLVEDINEDESPDGEYKVHEYKHYYDDDNNLIIESTNNGDWIYGMYGPDSHIRGWFDFLYVYLTSNTGAIYKVQFMYNF